MTPLHQHIIVYYYLYRLQNILTRRPSWQLHAHPRIGNEFYLALSCWAQTRNVQNEFPSATKTSVSV